MKALIRYAFQVNIGVPYLLCFPLAFLAPGPLVLSLAIWLLIAVPLLAIAAALRRRDRQREVIRPNVVDSLNKGLAQIPKKMGTPDRPSLIGIAQKAPYFHCHLLAAEVGSEVHVIVVSRWWPWRVRAQLVFESLAKWRKWAECFKVRCIPEGRYADAVYRRYFEPILG